MAHVVRNEGAPFAANRLAETGVFDRVLDAQATAPQVRRRRRTTEADVTRDTTETLSEEALGVALAHRAVVLAYL